MKNKKIAKVMVVALVLLGGIGGFAKFKIDPPIASTKTIHPQIMPLRDIDPPIA
ncbi:MULTISPECIES: hypothetical protein [unclassified Clostridium]|uniref:hypothetical protein n=1 Tax=unclassified Clostridium TaxID=2614128 RepID=UPI0025C32944|nr:MULTISPECIES: hypothetical protein [unclassified Clostridium]